MTNTWASWSTLPPEVVSNWRQHYLASVNRIYPLPSKWRIFAYLYRRGLHRRLMRRFDDYYLGRKP